MEDEIYESFPLLGNINNNANYIPQLTVAAAVAAAHNNGQIPTHLTGPPQILTNNNGTATASTIPAGLNDSPLEFKNNNNNINKINSNNINGGCGGDNQQKQLLKQQQIKNQIQGAGPMDLENDNEIINNTTISIAAEINKRLAKRENKCNSINLIDDDSSMTTNDNLNNGANGGGGNGQSIQQKSTALLMGNEMFLNGMLGGISGIGSHALPHQGFMMMQAASMMMDPTAMALQLQQQYPMLQTQTVPTVTPNPLANPSQLQHSQAQLQSSSQQQQQQQPQQSINSHDSQQNQQQNLPMKEIITCKTCTLYPPNPNAPPPTIRERPPGCRTVFVGGLPESITEEIIREIFESCGEITTLRLSKKNFCHIRFVFEASVDSAIYLSGYRIRIANSQDSINCGRLHVDYAQARDDQYEWECKQRQLQREQRHRERMERDRLRSLSPPPIVHYTEHEASTIAEKLKNDETFTKAVQTLIAWLERGDCSKKNANTFYTMIQSTNAHVRRLQSDKNDFEEELKKARENYRKQMLSMAQQFTQIEKVFNAASHKKVWDHFTKAQRKNIDQWKKLSMEMRSVQIEDDEMEMSEDDRDYRSSSSKRSRYDNEHLKDENDSLRCQLEVCKNEMTLVKSDQKSDTDVREKQIKVLQETIRNLQTQLLENKSKEKEYSTKITDLEEKLKQANVKELLLKTKIANNRISTAATVAAAAASTITATSAAATTTTILSTNSNSVEDLVENKIQLVNSCNSTVISNNLDNQKYDCCSDDTDQLVDTTDISKQTNNTQTKSEKIDLIDDARIIALVSTFLVVHPFGASPDYICSYLQKTHPNLRSRDLEEILGKYRCIFFEEITGIGMKIERKWKFCGYDHQIEQNKHQKNV